MRKTYIDCDGVILDTETGLFDLYNEMREFNPRLRKSEYLRNMNWEYWLYQAQVINNAINILKFYDPKMADILTKVHSLEEAKAKVKFFRGQGVRNNIVIVPNELSKVDVVSAQGNILVDDSSSNLDDWFLYGGDAIMFDNPENEYPSITTLDEVLDPEKVKKLLNR